MYQHILRDLTQPLEGVMLAYPGQSYLFAVIACGVAAWKLKELF